MSPVNDLAFEGAGCLPSFFSGDRDGVALAPLEGLVRAGGRGRLLDPLAFPPRGFVLVVRV